MACLIKAPDSSGKGCVTFTTPERDNAIYKDPALRAAVEKLKDRYLIGLHHNWHDHDFAYDPLFDFSMAGEGDLIERDGKAFPFVPIDACNFVPPCFHKPLETEHFWDVLNVSRAVNFKGIPEFFDAIRNIYDRGRFLRVLYLCPVPPAESDGSSLHDIRQRYEAMFSTTERRYFNLITMEWDYPFPLDLETLAFFYRASRVYAHAAPDERRCRIAGYAWTSKMPVVCRANVASILPSTLRRRPFWFKFDEPNGMADAILAACECDATDPESSNVVDAFRAEKSVVRLNSYLDDLAFSRAYRMSHCPINATALDIRLARHHLPNGNERNRVDQSLQEFCEDLFFRDEASLAAVSVARDPETTLANADLLPGVKRRDAEKSARSLLRRMFSANK